MSKHRPSVSNENYDSVMAFDGKSFNEKLSSVFDLRTQHVLRLHEAEQRNNELEAKLIIAKSEAAYSDNRLQAASKEIAQLKRKNNAADEHIIELNKELEFFREWLETERAECNEQSDKISKLNETIKAGVQQIREADVENFSLKNRLSTESARAARYKFTTAIYGLCAIGFLIGWIHG